MVVQQSGVQELTPATTKMPSTPPHYSDAGWLQWPDNEACSFQFMRTLGAAQEGASTVSERFFAARLITLGDVAAPRNRPSASLGRSRLDRIVDFRSSNVDEHSAIALTHIPFNHAKDKISSLVHLSPVRYGTMWAPQTELIQ